MADSSQGPRRKQMGQRPITGVDMETMIGYLLLVGVLTSAALLLGGLAWHWAVTRQLGVMYTVAGMNVFQFVVAEVRQVFAGDVRPRLLISLGIAMLMLTPYLRVLVSMVYFALDARNWKYTLFTGFVLSVLTYSLFLR